MTGGDGGAAGALAAGLRRVRPHVADRGRWVSLSVGATMASAAVGLWWLLLHAEQVSLTGHEPLVVVAALTYTGLSLLVLLRRRVDRFAGLVVVVALHLLMLAEGTTYPEPSLRWVCLAFLTVLPLLAVVMLGRWAALASTLASAATVLVVVHGLPATAEVRTYVASVMATLVCVPVLVVGVLLAQLERARTVAQRAAGRDPLTGLLNRRGVQERLPGYVAAARTAGDALSVTVVDVDHFKRVNDEHGHLVGDEVLARVARTLTASTGPDVLLWRLGGEEVAWLARHETGDDPRAEADPATVAERARAAVGAATGGPRVTVSVGVARGGPLSGPVDPTALLDGLLTRADAALYRAKAAGRDRVEVAAPASAAPPRPPSVLDRRSA